jgi:hypothetical protein
MAGNFSIEIPTRRPPSLCSPLMRRSPDLADPFWKSIKVRIDAFVIGAPKCATKWLAQGLRNSGLINIPGECQGLTRLADDNAAYYNSFFSSQEKSHTKFTIDYSNTYMLDASLPEKIKKKFGAVPIILCFRNPVARAFSHYLMDITYGYFEFDQTYGFSDALRSPRTYSYFDFGLYRKNLESFLDVFGSQRVMVIDADTINKDRFGALQKVLTFLGFANAPISPVPENINTWALFRQQHLGERAEPLVKPVPSDQDRQWLWEFYRQDHELFLKDVERLPNVVRF